MIWKLLGLQKKLDALFDDGWLSLGIATHETARRRTEGCAVHLM
jgi:hypothetical protein